jgi:hypothetical protein
MVAAVLKESTGFLGAERRDRRPEGFAATRLGFAHQALYLAESLLDEPTTMRP